MDLSVLNKICWTVCIVCIIVGTVLSFTMNGSLVHDDLGDVSAGKPIHVEGVDVGGSAVFRLKCDARCEQSSGAQ